MSSFPDWLYKFTPRDEQVTSLEHISFSGSAVAAATQVNITPDLYIVPSDRILLLQTISLYGAGTAQFMAHAEVSAYLPSSSAFFWVGNETNEIQVAGQAWSRTLNVNAVIPPSWQLSASAIFSAAVNNNLYQVSGSGVLIPRGNFAF